MEKKWNLDDILTIENFDDLYQTIGNDLEKLIKFVNRLDPKIGKNDFKEIMFFGEDFSDRLSRLSALPGLMEAANQKDAQAKMLKARAENLALKCSEVGIAMSLWLQGKREPKLDDTNAKRLFGVIEDLKYSLERGREAAKYSLLEGEEKIIVNKDINGMGALSDIREMMESEMEYEIGLGGKKKKIKTQAKLLSLVYNPRAEVRKEAYRALLEKQKENILKLYTIYQAVVRDWNYEAKLRGYKSAIAVRNFGNDVPDEAVEELLAVCKKNVGVFRNYFEWKASKLRMKKLTRSDIYAPILGKERKYTIEEAEELVLSSLKKFGHRFYEYGRQIIDEKHVDWEDRKNKRGGAFCATVSPKISPYILLNFTGKQRDVSTLAHELGHGIHSLYAQNHFPSTQQAQLPLAETASTLAEMIVFEEMLKNEEDKRIKEAMLSDKMAEAYATICRQNYFIIFEKEAHKKVPEGITAENLSDIYLNNLKEQFGKSVLINPLFRYEWSYIAHIFESPFYCYAYNFGQLLALALYSRYKKNPAEWRTKIEKILMAGGSQNPEMVLRGTGIDIRQSGFWQGSFEIIKGWFLELTKVS